jgi:hypothetical protein
MPEQNIGEIDNLIRDLTKVGSISKSEARTRINLIIEQALTSQKAYYEDEIKELKEKWYPHMCRDGHDEVGHKTDYEDCPACKVKQELEKQKEEFIKSLELLNEFFKEKKCMGQKLCNRIEGLILEYKI